MESLNTQVPRGFSLKCRSIKKEKSYFICSSDKGLNAIKKVSSSREDITIWHSVKETLYINGFKNIDRFIISEDGSPYVVVDGETYVATDYFSSTHRDSDFGNRVDFSKIVSSVSEIHGILKKATLENEELFSGAPILFNESVENIYNKNTSDLKGYKKNLSRQSRLSDFDVMFLKNYDFFTQSLEKWHDVARNSDYHSVIDEGIFNNYICHNLLKEETVLKSPDGELFVTNFSECGKAHFVNDLSSIIKRHVKCAASCEVLPLKAVLEIYNEKNSLSHEELIALCALLIFPDKFLKLCAKYYERKRTWIPAAFIGRIAEISNIRENMALYTNEFFNSL